MRNVSSRIGRPLGTVTALLAAGLCLIGCSASGQADAGATSSGEPSASVAATASVTPTATPTPTRAAVPGPTAPPPASSSARGTALALLATLPVKAALPITGYQRTTDFGAAWLDADHNGCDTRDDILARDLSSITRNSKCQVLTGSLSDPYTGQTIAFQRGEKTSALVQIDHVVPLGDAWQTGAQSLTQTQRDDFANDDGNLLAVDEHDNEQKGDKDAASWLPPDAAFRCKYVAIQVSIKAAYGLWVTPAESAAMNSVLNGCPSQPTTTSEFEKVPTASASSAAGNAAAAAQAAAEQAAQAAAAAHALASAVPASPARNPGSSSERSVSSAPVKSAAPPAPAPPASAPRKGEFCSAADHGVTIDGLTCEQKAAASGTLYWRWES